MANKNILKMAHDYKREGCRIGILCAGELIAGAIWNANCDTGALTDEQLAVFQQRVKAELDDIMRKLYSDDPQERMENVEAVVEKCRQLREKEAQP